jgi:hypothetical protein
MAAATGDRHAEILFFALIRSPPTGINQDHFETAPRAATTAGSSPADEMSARIAGAPVDVAGAIVAPSPAGIDRPAARRTARVAI